MTINKKITFLDIETTSKSFTPGPVKCFDSIVEVAAAIVNLENREIELEKNWLIQPHGPQSKIRINEIRDWDFGEFHLKHETFKNVDWDLGQDRKEVMLELSQNFLIPGAVVGAQNPNFDLNHLERDFAELNIEWPKLNYHIFDLASPALFLVMGGVVESPSLRHTSVWAGCSKQKHRALDDVHDTIKTFWSMYDFFMSR